MIDSNTFIIVSKILACLVGVLALFFTWRLINFAKNFQLLSNQKLPDDPQFKWPKVSMLIPVCNEEITLEKAAKSLFSMDYPHLEFIFVNDRSTDQTEKILLNLAQAEPRMKIITIELLPQGWLGGMNAYQQGLRLATGEWLLCSDADVIYHPTALKKAFAYVLRNQIDFLSIIPSVIGGTFFVRFILAYILHYQSLLIDFKGISNRQHPYGFGHGTFMLMTRSIYNQSRGFEWLKMEVLYDGGLAEEMKHAGAKAGILGGLNAIEFEWYSSVKGLFKGFEKNSFSPFQYSILILGAYLFALLCVFMGYTVAPFLTRSIFYPVFTWGSVAVYLFATERTLRSIIKISPWSILLFPIAFWVVPAIIIRAAYMCLKQRGIYWRSTFYSLSEIKKGQKLKILKFLQ